MREPRRIAEPSSDEYDVVALRISWGGVSIAAFLLALFGREVIRALPWRPYGVYTVAILGVLFTAACGFTGLLTALLGLRSGRGTAASRWGLLLNGAVVGCVLLIVLGFVYIRYIR